MPLYDYICPKCELQSEHINKIAERQNQPCDNCGANMNIQLTVGQYIPFKEGWYEHIDKKPIYCSSKRQLRDECRKRGLTSIYAEEG